jgi:chromosomal replication initiation ATPase DnaA
MEDKEKIIQWIIEKAEKDIQKESGVPCKLFIKKNIDLLGNSEIGKMIIGICAAEFGIESSQLILSTRVRSLVEPRQISMYLIRKHTLLSLDEIGMFYMTSRTHEQDSYGKDHTTIIHAIRSVENLIETDKRFAIKFNRITENINQILY